jgi:hypothetical protein
MKTKRVELVLLLMHKDKCMSKEDDGCLMYMDNDEMIDNYCSDDLDKSYKSLIDQLSLSKGSLKGFTDYKAEDYISQYSDVCELIDKHMDVLDGIADDEIDMDNVFSLLLKLDQSCADDEEILSKYLAFFLLDKEFMDGFMGILSKYYEMDLTEKNYSEVAGRYIKGPFNVYELVEIFMIFARNRTCECAHGGLISEYAENKKMCEGNDGLLKIYNMISL